MLKTIIGFNFLKIKKMKRFTQNPKAELKRFWVRLDNGSGGTRNLFLGGPYINLCVCEI